MKETKDKKVFPNNSKLETVSAAVVLTACLHLRAKRIEKHSGYEEYLKGKPFYELDQKIVEALDYTLKKMHSNIYRIIDTELKSTIEGEKPKEKEARLFAMKNKLSLFEQWCLRHYCEGYR